MPRLASPVTHILTLNAPAKRPCTQNVVSWHASSLLACRTSAHAAISAVAPSAASHVAPPLLGWHSHNLSYALLLHIHTMLPALPQRGGKCLTSPPPCTPCAIFVCRAALRKRGIYCRRMRLSAQRHSPSAAPRALHAFTSRTRLRSYNAGNDAAAARTSRRRQLFNARTRVLRILTPSREQCRNMPT